MYKTFFSFVALRHCAAVDDAFLLRSFITHRTKEREGPFPESQDVGTASLRSIPNHRGPPAELNKNSVGISASGHGFSFRHVEELSAGDDRHNQKRKDSHGPTSARKKETQKEVTNRKEQYCRLEERDAVSGQRKREHPDSDVVVLYENVNRKSRRTHYLEPDDKDLEALVTPRSFISSFVINWYVNMLKVEAHQDVQLFTTDDFSEYSSEPQKERQSDEFDRFWRKAADKKYLVLPAHLEDRKHFVTVLVDTSNRAVTVYDSLFTRAHHTRLSRFRRFLNRAYRQEETPYFSCRWADLNTPQQADGSNDCAGFVMSFIRSLQKSGGRTIISRDGACVLFDKDARTELGLNMRERFREEIESKKLLEWIL